MSIPGTLQVSISQRPTILKVSSNQKLDPNDEEAFKGAMAMGAKFAAYAPHFKAPLQPDESVSSMLKILTNASIEKGDGGAFISHLGNKQWL